MERFLVIFLALLLALEVKTTSTDNQQNFVRDVNGNPHMVNPNPYSVVDAHLEPKFTAETDIFFRLYTKINPETDQILKPNDTVSITSSNFNPEHPTRFLIHGWNQNGDSAVLVQIRRSYLSVGEFNVISVDWGKGAQTINYFTARFLVGSVGRVSSQMIDTIVRAYDGVSTTDRINVIGHSLGAHIAAVVGKFQRGQLNTIVGLDPAGPLFIEGGSDALARQDAQYVETVCTCAGLLGFSKPLGDANFYPNGGLVQPGCGLDLFGSCAHSRSWAYFAESITSGIGFGGIKCASFEELEAKNCGSNRPTTARMGGEPSNHGRGVDGVFNVRTNAQEPFAKG